MSAFPIINRRTPLIADDHAVIRKMARLTLQRFPQFEVCGEAEDGIQAVDQAKKANPDVVILNVVMPYLHDFEVVREIKKETPQAAIVILSTHAWALFLSLHFRRLLGYRLRWRKADRLLTTFCVRKPARTSATRFKCIGPSHDSWLEESKR